MMQTLNTREASNSGGGVRSVRRYRNNLMRIPGAPQGILELFISKNPRTQPLTQIAHYISSYSRAHGLVEMDDTQQCIRPLMISVGPTRKHAYAN